MLFAQKTEDCGDRILIEAIEDADFTSARGDISSGTNWKFARLFDFNYTADDNIDVGIQSEDGSHVDTTFICYPDVISPTAISYQGTTVYLYPWHFDVFDELLSRDQMAAIPNPDVTENCPDTVYNNFELWYSDEGYARYKKRGSVYQYEIKVDTISDIVEKEIIKKQCLKIKANKTIKATSDGEIVLRRGYCTEKNTNDKDVIEIVRGELVSYKGVDIDGDIITFRDSNFKLTFAKGTVKLKKADKGGQLQFISNVPWN